MKDHFSDKDLRDGEQKTRTEPQGESEVLKVQFSDEDLRDEEQKTRTESQGKSGVLEETFSDKDLRDEKPKQTHIEPQVESGVLEENFLDEDLRDEEQKSMEKKQMLEAERVHQTSSVQAADTSISQQSGAVTGSRYSLDETSPIQHHVHDLFQFSMPKDRMLSGDYGV